MASRKKLNKNINFDYGKMFITFIFSKITVKI